MKYWFPFRSKPLPLTHSRWEFCVLVGMVFTVSSIRKMFPLHRFCFVSWYVIASLLLPSSSLFLRFLFIVSLLFCSLSFCPFSSSSSPSLLPYPLGSCLWIAAEMNYWVEFMCEFGTVCLFTCQIAVQTNTKTFRTTVQASGNLILSSYTPFLQATGMHKFRFF